MPLSDSTIQQLKLPLTNQMINWVGKIGKKYGINLVKLSENSLLKTAYRETGLYDWGEDDFRAPFKTLLDSFEREANLNLLGRVAARQTCIRLLTNRLYIQENLRRNPEILQIPVIRPLFIIGLTRTGTTLLHNLLAQDPDVRVPLMWELMYPSPLPFKKIDGVDSRIKLSEKKIRQLYSMAPQIFSIHPYNHKGPEECILLFQNALRSFYFVLYYHVPQYTEWLLQQDMFDAYKYFLRQLQLLHWQCPAKRWVLKSPAHLYSLDALFSVFPDACLIQTHRDPKKVIPSICSLSGMATKMSSDEVNLKYLGEKGLFLCKTAVDRGMKVRNSDNAAQFYDVHYQDIISNPTGVVRSIYDYFGYEFTTRMEEKMKSWLKANPQHKYGRHKYSLEEFDLDKKTIDTQFAAYRKRFNVKSE